MGAATLESVFAYCLGSKIFGLLIRTGVISAEACQHCQNIWARAPAPT